MNKVEAKRKEQIIDAYLDSVNGYIEKDEEKIIVHPLGDFPIEYTNEDEMIADMIYTLEQMEEQYEL